MRSVDDIDLSPKPGKNTGRAVTVNGGKSLFIFYWLTVFTTAINDIVQILM